MLKIKGKLITDAGLIAEVLSETPTRVKVVIKDLFFPSHSVKGEFFQVEKCRRDWMRERLIGREREFWKTGSRMNFEVGGDHQVTDWDFNN